MSGIWQDVRYGLRQLQRSPGFTLVAVLTLALGIGANTAVFSLIDQVLLRPLPVREPQQLVVLRSTEGRSGSVTYDYDPAASFSYPMYKDLRDRSQVFSGLVACYGPADANISLRGRAERASEELVSGNFFQVLGVRPALGRVFSSGDETVPGANPVVVLSYSYWARHFGGDPSVLNRSIDVNGTPLTVVGVAQKGFAGTEIGAAPDVFVPVNTGRSGLDDTSNYFLAVIGRLNPGMTRGRAEVALQPLFHSILESELPAKVAAGTLDSPRAREYFLGGQIELAPGAQGQPILQHQGEAPLVLLMAMVGVVLLIVCANLAGLLLARGEARRHESAVRLALGADRPRLLRQHLTESLLVAVGGGVAGLPVAWWTLEFVVSATQRGTAVAGLTASLDFRVLAFCAAAALASGFIFGLLPALRSSRANLHAALKEASRSSSTSVSGARLRKSLVIVQVAMTALLLVVSGLFAESLLHLEHVDVGMNVRHVVQFSVEPGLSKYTPARTLALFDRLRQDLAAVPGVTSVAAAEVPLLADASDRNTMTFEGYVPRKGDDRTVSINRVSSDFFSTVGIPLVLGRAFRDSDSASSPKVCIISEKLAREYFSGHNPLGMHLATGWGPKVRPDTEIVGVVADAKSMNVRDPVQPTVYFPYAQDPGVGSATFYIRTGVAPGTVAASLRDVVARDAPGLPVYGVQTLTEQVNGSLFGDRLVTFFALSLGLVAAFLASLGLYGVTAYVVVQRTHEIGIRVALGALPRDVARIIFRQAAQLVAIGLVIGVAGALGSARLVGSLLYDVKAGDPPAFVLSALLLVLVAFAACYLPARRAMRIDPAQALRQE